jgi:hypothetical protein
MQRWGKETMRHRFGWRTLAAVAAIVFILPIVLVMTRTRGVSVSRYHWVEVKDFAWTAAVIEGRSEADIVRGYGGDPDHPVGVMPFAVATSEEIGVYSYVQTFTHDRYVVVLENNGWAGADPTLAREMSRNGGQFFSIYWSPVSERIVQAADGKLIANFIPTFPPPYLEDLYPAWWTDEMFCPPTMYSGMLEAMTQQTGLVFKQEWLDKELPTYRIPNKH